MEKVKFWTTTTTDDTREGQLSSQNVRITENYRRRKGEYRTVRLTDGRLSVFRTDRYYDQRRNFRRSYRSNWRDSDDQRTLSNGGHPWRTSPSPSRAQQTINWMRGTEDERHFSCAIFLHSYAMLAWSLRCLKIQYKQSISTRPTVCYNHISFLYVRNNKLCMCAVGRPQWLQGKRNKKNGAHTTPHVFSDTF